MATKTAAKSKTKHPAKSRPKKRKPPQAGRETGRRKAGGREAGSREAGGRNRLPSPARAQARNRQGAGEQCRGDQGGRHQGRRQGRGRAARRRPTRSRRDHRFPAARSFGCRRPQDDQERQEARLCDLRAAQRRAALRGSHLRADRGRARDAQRHGHQRRRIRGSRRGRGESEEDDDDDDAGSDLVEVSQKAVTETKKSEPGERTDDPVRMYLREMGSVELLSREGEIAIAKRIEAGREAMIAGLCESPLTFQAIIIWRDELNEGKVFLRDIIDLEATYAGPDAVKGMPAGAPGIPGQPGAAAAPAPCGRARRRDPRRPDAGRGAAVGAAGRDPVPSRRLPAAARLPPAGSAAPTATAPPRKARKARRPASAISTTTTWRIRSRSRRSKPS